MELPPFLRLRKSHSLPKYSLPQVRSEFVQRQRGAEDPALKERSPCGAEECALAHLGYQPGNFTVRRLLRGDDRVVALQSEAEAI